MKIGELIRRGTIELKVGEIESPKLKARLLLQFLLNKPRQYLIVNDDAIVNSNIEKLYFESIKKMREGTPLQYITNGQEFMKLNFYVDENVLIPRPDTEILVEEVINIVKKTNSKKILDLCTGSGAIAVSLAKYLNDCEVVAVDISKEALRVAKKNAKINEVENKITFIESDLFTNLTGQKYDIIVSNPPYIKKDKIKLLDKEVRKEPIISLDGGIDGLDFYRKIIKNGFEYLKYNGYLCLEIGYDQKEEVIDLLKNEGSYIGIYSKKDLYGNDRIVVGNLGG